MVCFMIGSQFFALAKAHTSADRVAIVNFGVASGSMLLAAVSIVTRETCEENQIVLLLGFLIFEACCGLYYPAMGTLKATYLPEKTRATLMNIFRCGLNLMLVIVLVQVIFSLVFKPYICRFPSFQTAQCSSSVSVLCAPPLYFKLFLALLFHESQQLQLLK